MKKSTQASYSPTLLLTYFLLTTFLSTCSQNTPKNKPHNYQWDSSIENKTTLAQNLFAKDGKQRGAHAFIKIDSTNLQPLIRNNFEWITYVPFGDQEDYDSPSVGKNFEDSLQLKKRDSLWINNINLAHEFGFKVMYKPHIWLYRPTDGKWRSEIFPNNKTDWETWKASYREFIFRHAKLAQKGNAELFCIGTELSRLSIEKPEFWEKLIQDVRKIYTGKITYAANWYNEFEKITFWDQLDFIGIQAYFPLVKNEHPSIQQISKGWKQHLPTIERVHQKFNKKILFTEMGYKSTPDSAIEPWTWINYNSEIDSLESTETQANCYQAFFDAVWEKEWFAGVHIWQWSSYKDDGSKNNVDFTPVGKPAENIIAKGFGKKK